MRCTVFKIHILFLLVLNSVASVYGQNKLPRTNLSESMLQEVGIHLPSYMTLSSQAEYQKGLYVHDSVQILWDIYPGLPKKYKSRQLPKVRPTGDLSVTEILRSKRGFHGNDSWDVEHSIIEIGLTDSNEIRSINRENDTRYENTTTDIYDTKVYLDAWISCDSAITKIAVYETTRINGAWHLVFVGSVTVQGGTK